MKTHRGFLVILSPSLAVLAAASRGIGAKPNGGGRRDLPGGPVASVAGHETKGHASDRAFQPGVAGRMTRPAPPTRRDGQAERSQTDARRTVSLRYEGRAGLVRGEVESPPRGRASGCRCLPRTGPRGSRASGWTAASMDAEQR